MPWTQIAETVSAAVTLTDFEFTLDGVAGKRIKSIRVLETTDSDEPLHTVANLAIAVGDQDWAPLIPCDLFDDNEPLIWDGDFFVTPGMQMRMRYVAAAIGYVYRVYVEWDYAEK